ncbi:DUF2059 domain-containing protein [bacterium]|jgi:thioredoxin 1|nr:DUF2059 domain-containing protein [bacterium]MBT5014995.1 DUF2059 domain-containing protein [bacterium]
MKNLIIAVALITTFPLMGHTTETNELVKGLIAPQWLNQVEAFGKQLNITDQELLIETKLLVIDNLEKNLDILVEGYLKIFSVEELKAMSEFFQSEVGKKYTNKSIDLASDAAVMQVATSVMTEVMQKLQTTGAQPEVIKASPSIASITTQEELDELTQDNPLVVVKFYADWCGPCKALNGLYNDLYNEHSSIKFVSVNIDNARELAVNYKVQGIPAVVLIKDGTVVDEIVGCKPEELKKSVALLK